MKSQPDMKSFLNRHIFSWVMIVGVRVGCDDSGMCVLETSVDSVVHISHDVGDGKTCFAV